MGGSSSTLNDLAFIRVHPRLAPSVLLKRRYSIAGRNAVMSMNGHIHKVVANHVSDNPGTKANLARILCSG